MRPDLHYKAFLSYDQDDIEWARWLQKALETFSVPKSLVGAESLKGPVPAVLRPIFRDRPDLPASSSYHKKIQSVLEHADHLIVICSTNSARSTYVDDEIRRYKLAGKEDRILALIVNGEPGDPERECFPPSLRFKVADDGSLTQERAEPLAADARPQRDGRHLAFLKLTAGLLGVELDDLIRREEEAKRRRSRNWAALAALMTMLAAAAAGSSVYAFNVKNEAQQNLLDTINAASEFIETASQMSETHGMPRAGMVRLLEKAEGILAKLADKGAEHPQYQLARAKLLRAFAVSHQRAGQTDLWVDRSNNAVATLTQLTSAYPDNAEYAQTLAHTYPVQVSALMDRHNRAKAATQIASLSKLTEDWLTKTPRDLTWREQRCESNELKARLAYDTGEIDGALKLLHACDQGRKEILAQAAPLGLTAQDTLRIERAHARTLNELGAIMMDHKHELDSAERYLERARKLLESREGRDASPASLEILASSEASLGYLELRRQDLEKASQHFDQASRIARRLVFSQAGDVRWRALLVRAELRRGELLARRGQGETALNLLKRASRIAEEQAERDPNNLRWVIDVGDSQLAIGSLHRRLENWEACTEAIEKSLTTLQRAADLDPQKLHIEQSSGRAEGLLGICKGKLAKAEHAPSSSSPPSGLEKLQPKAPD